MGFGICLIANCLFLFDVLGFDVIGFALFGYGFSFLSESDRRFFPGVYFAAAGLVPTIVRALHIFGVIDLSRYDFAFIILQCVISALLIAIYGILFVGAKRIAHANDAPKLSAQCTTAIRLSTMVLSLYIITNIVFYFFGATISALPSLMGISFALKYIIIFIISIYIYFCFASITTPKLYRKEQRANAKLVEKEQKAKEKREKSE